MWSLISIGILCSVPIISGRASVKPRIPEEIEEPSPDLEAGLLVAAAVDGKCGNNRNPIPNLESALRGYNVIQGNRFSSKGNDPGFKSTIFKGTFKDPAAGDEMCTYSNIKQYEATYCRKLGISQSYRSYLNYQEAKTSSVKNSNKVGGSFSAGSLFSFITNFEATASLNRTSNTEFSKEKKFFSESKGEIYMNKARCEVYEVRISSSLKPEFTDDFISALKYLENAAKNPESADSKEAMKEFFTKQFGTHYMSEVFMGASMTAENRYVGTNSSSEMRSMRKECSDNSYGISIGGGGGGANVSAQYQNAAKKCKGDESSNSFFSENSYSEFNVVTRGSIPTLDEDEWRMNIKKSPIPFRFELEPISDLFRTEWLEEHDLDAALLKDYVTNSLRSYCEVVLGQACVPAKGCGVTGSCLEDDEVCSADYNNKSGYRCNRCGFGWEFNQDNQKCYAYVGEKKTWEDGQKYCIQRAPNPFGDLASAPDKKTNQFISSVSVNKNSGWIGGFKNENNKNEEWTWSDGSRWGFTSWAKGEPNNAWWEENRLMTNWKNGLGKWNDAKAKEKELFFCQYPLKGCYLEFAVKGRKDAHILLAPCNKCSGYSNQGYSVVIGGWGNTKSAIQNKADTWLPTATYEDTPGILSEKEFRKFWIRMGEGNANSISVGRGGEDEPFIHKTLDERHAVFYAAFMGADSGNTNQWRIKMKNEVKEISTSDKFKYLKYYCYNK